MLGLTLVTAITATVVVSAGTVAADQVSDLKAQAAQIAQDLVLEQLQIGTDQQQYDVDSAKVQRDEAEIASTQNQIQSDTLRVSRDRKRLQAEAVSAYVNVDPSDGILFEGSQSDAFARAEYEDVTSGDTELTIDVLHTDENGLRRRTRHARAARGTGPGDHQPGGDAGQRRAIRHRSSSIPSSPRSPASSSRPWPSSRQHRPRPPPKRSGPHRPLRPPPRPRPPRPRQRAVLHRAQPRPRPPLRGTGDRRRHLVWRSGTPSLPPMRPTGRVGRELRRRVARGHVHGRLPIQPAHVERSGPTGRHAAARQRPTEPGDSG